MVFHCFYNEETVVGIWADLGRFGELIRREYGLPGGWRTESAYPEFSGITDPAVNR